MSGETILIEQLRADVERLELGLAAVAMCDSSDCGLCVSCLVKRAEKAERERDEARANYAFMVERAADQKLDGYRELGARAAAAEERAEKAERERDALRHHYDKAGPEHNLLALLDMYDERRAAAESERDEARAERDALHVALELAEVDVALDRSWCRICRTECRGVHRGRREHVHAAECVLNIRAHAAKVKP